LDVVGRRAHTLGEQSNLTHTPRLERPPAPEVTGQLVKGASVVRMSVAPYIKISGSFFVAQRRRIVDLGWLLSGVQLFDDFGDRIEPIDASLVLEVFPARVGPP